MLIARDAATLADAMRTLRRDRRIALVPTMGALHAGHMALVDAAGRDGSAVAASIFVNPTQFDQRADLDRYPVEHERDLALLRERGCALAWLPAAADIYPAGHAARIDPGPIAREFEGAARPGHFRGVATVVTILLGLVRPSSAWFGEKDWQQLQVIRRVVADLRLGVDIRGVATQREADGLAMSSRNRFLTADERRVAPALHQELLLAAGRLRDGEAARETLDAAVHALAARGFETDYLSLVDGRSLAPRREASHGSRLLAAARLGSVRLLDNVDAGIDADGQRLASAQA